MLREVMHNGSILKLDPKEEPNTYDGALEGYIGSCPKCDQSITLMSPTLYEHVKTKYVRHVALTNPDKVKDVNAKYGDQSFQKGIEHEFLVRWPLHVCGRTGIDLAKALDEKEQELIMLREKMLEMEKASITAPRSGDQSS